MTGQGGGRMPRSRRTSLRRSGGFARGPEDLGKLPSLGARAENLRSCAKHREHAHLSRFRKAKADGPRSASTLRSRAHDRMSARDVRQEISGPGPQPKLSDQAPGPTDELVLDQNPITPRKKTHQLAQERRSPDTPVVRTTDTGY
jgi:hypothetical protein